MSLIFIGSSNIPYVMYPPEQTNERLTINGQLVVGKDVQRRDLKTNFRSLIDQMRNQWNKTFPRMPNTTIYSTDPKITKYRIDHQPHDRFNIHYQAPKKNENDINALSFAVVVADNDAELFQKTAVYFMANGLRLSFRDHHRYEIKVRSCHDGESFPNLDKCKFSDRKVALLRNGNKHVRAKQGYVNRQGAHSYSMLHEQMKTNVFQYLENKKVKDKEDLDLIVHFIESIFCEIDDIANGVPAEILQLISSIESQFDKDELNAISEFMDLEKIKEFLVQVTPQVAVM